MYRLVVFLACVFFLGIVAFCANGSDSARVVALVEVSVSCLGVVVGGVVVVVAAVGVAVFVVAVRHSHEQQVDFVLSLKVRIC